MNECIFRTRFKECYKQNGFTQVSLAIKLNVSVDTIKKYCRKGAELPPMPALKNIADILHVDTAYLLGEQDCKSNKSQTICDVTKLNETSAKVLSSLDGISADIMNELLNHEDFIRLILFAWDYTHSHNKKVEIINTLDNSKDLPLVDDTQREVMKYRAVDTFGKILDELYDTHLQEAINAKLGFIFQKMKSEIEAFIKYKDEDEARQSLLKIASYWQDEIKKLRPNSTVCKLTPEQIIDNFDLIKEYL